MINLVILHLNDNVIGVYSSMEKAEAALVVHRESVSLPHLNDSRFYHVREFTLDDPAY